MAFVPFLVLLLSVLGPAQLDNPLFPRRAAKYLTLTTTASATSAKAGSKVSLFVDVVPNRGIHVYAPGAVNYQVIAVTLDPSPRIVVAGKAAYPKSEILFFEPLNERVPVFEKPFRITQDITLARSAKAGSTLTVKGTVAYQACDDKVCFFPDSVPVSWTLTVN